INVINFFVLYFCVVFISFSALIGRCFQGLKKSNKAVVILNLLQPSFVSIFVTVTFLVNGNVDFEKSLLLLLLSSFLVFIYSIYELFKLYGKVDFFIKHNDFDSKNRLKFYEISNKLLFVCLLQNLVPWSLIFIVDNTLGTESVSVFNFIQKLASISSIAVICLNFIISPHIAKLSNNNSGELRSFIKKCLTGIIICISLLSVIVIYLFDYVVRFFDPIYISYFNDFLILALGYIFYSVMIFLSMVYTMTGLEKYLLKIYVFFLPWFLVGALFFTSEFGISGLVSCILFCYFFQMLIQSYIFFRK
ncbi:lipopolysaccharide biosynthesis protein, partial [Vibrio cyclitrophicus]